MKKSFTLLIAITFVSLAANAQSVEKKIEEQARNKKRVENAAKADVFIINKKNIVDTSETGLNARDYAFDPNPKKKEPAKKQQKKKACKKKQ